jgi:hypothetical protein
MPANYSVRRVYRDGVPDIVEEKGTDLRAALDLRDELLEGTSRHTVYIDVIDLDDPERGTIDEDDLEDQCPDCGGSEFLFGQGYAHCSGCGWTGPDHVIAPVRERGA